ncbi:MAG: hypothetical protein ACR2LF_11735 [Jatrophihabitantaceae bacterium]
MLIRSLPTKVALDALAETPGLLTLGLGGDAAEPIRIDLFAGTGRLLVAGPPRSGRSNALRVLLVQLLGQSVRVLVAAPRRSPLTGIARERGCRILTPEDAVWPADVLCDDLGATARTAVLVDDSEAFLDTAVGDALASYARAAPPLLAVVAAGRSEEIAVIYRGIAAEVRRARCGLLLQPGPIDGELVGLRLPRRRHPGPAGRGFLVGDGCWSLPEASEPTPIQVAVP